MTSKDSQGNAGELAAVFGKRVCTVADRPYLEATRYAIAELIVSVDQLEHVRLEAGNPDMTLREAAVWMTDHLFPVTPYDPSTPRRGMEKTHATR